jgi:hypothetical protein
MTDNTALDPWFSIVEIEVNSLCNRACDYCPVSVLPTPETPRFMSEEVFGRILASLQSIDYAGKFRTTFTTNRSCAKTCTSWCAEPATPSPRRTNFSTPTATC